MTKVDFNNMLLKNTEFLKPFALTLTRDSEKAKDLIQDTMFRALTNREKYNVGTNIKAWLYTIMRNIFINGYRKAARQNTIFDHSENNFLISTNKNVIANTAVSQISYKEIQTLIDGLPEIFKNPFMLYYDGYKYQEISDILGEPLGTIKSRIHFARKLLKENIVRH
jgi:RNA polymerase sigma factor (sigma-70 family)